MAYDIYMHFDGAGKLGGTIEGETSDTEMEAKKAFEIYSFSLGSSNPVSIGSAVKGLSAGKVSISSFNVMKQTDKSSPSLFAACCNGDHFPKAIVTLRRSGTDAKAAGKAFMTYEFQEVMVESVQWSGSSGGDSVPTESVSFAFGSVTISYMPTDTTGALGDAIIQSWSLVKNEASAAVA
jgi:type VI secretion system secreted protein Hcp